MPDSLFPNLSDFSAFSPLLDMYKGNFPSTVSTQIAYLLFALESHEWTYLDADLQTDVAMI